MYSIVNLQQRGLYSTVYGIVVVESIVVESIVVVEPSVCTLVVIVVVKIVVVIELALYSQSGAVALVEL